MKLGISSPFRGNYHLSKQVQVACSLVVAFAFLICVVFVFEGIDGVDNFIFGSLRSGVPIGLCKSSEGITDICQDRLMEEIRCPRLLSQKMMVYISIFLGLFGIDHLYARNLQLFFPKMLLSVFVLPYLFERMLASLPAHTPRHSKVGSSTSSPNSESKYGRLEGETENDGSNIEKKEDPQDDDHDYEVEEIDATLQFDFKLLACFGFLLILTHAWWIVDIILWSFNFYTTGLGGAWFGNPVEQCPLKSW